jgi:hypothetical protein
MIVRVVFDAPVSSSEAIAGARECLVDMNYYPNFFGQNKAGEFVIRSVKPAPMKRKGVPRA